MLWLFSLLSFSRLPIIDVYKKLKMGMVWFVQRSVVLVLRGVILPDAGPAGATLQALRPATDSEGPEPAAAPRLARTYHLFVRLIRISRTNLYTIKDLVCTTRARRYEISICAGVNPLARRRRTTRRAKTCRMFGLRQGIAMAEGPEACAIGDCRG